MSNADLVKSVLSAFESGDAKKAESLLSDDMVFAGPVPKPVSKHEFIELQSALVAAIPDWKFNAGEYKEQGDKVLVKVHISGTHSKPLTLPPMGIQSLPSTSKHVQLPYENLTATVKNGKVTRIDGEHVEGGGVPGLLSQLGVKMPQL
jgi:predicted ester cyclase